MVKTLDDHVFEMKKFGNLLMPFNYPRANKADEDEINCIKAREITVDGYSLIVHYSKADHGNYFAETLQVLGKFTPFLPFSLVCKVGRGFFGKLHLALVELYRDGRKIYCWTKLTDKSGAVIPAASQDGEEIERCNYEGFEYQCLDPNKVDFY